MSGGQRIIFDHFAADALLAAALGSLAVCGLCAIRQRCMGLLHPCDGIYLLYIYPIFTHYEDIKGDEKCKNWGGLGS